MDTNTQNSSGMMNGMPPVNSAEGNKSPKKGIVGLIIVVIVIILAVGFYSWTRTSDTSIVDEGSALEQSVAEDSSPATSQSDDLNAISADLEAQLEDVDYSF